MGGAHTRRGVSLAAENCSCREHRASSCGEGMCARCCRIAMAREADAAAIMSALDMCLQPHSNAEADTWRLRTTALRYAIFVLTTAWLLATVETPAPPQPFSADRDTRHTHTREMLARARTCQFEEEVALARGKAAGGGGGRRFRVRERLRRMLYFSPITTFSHMYMSPTSM